MNPINEYVTLKGQQKISVSEILRVTSFDVYQTDIHYDICSELARRRGSDLVEQRLLTNIYALKSNLARSATALSAYVLNANLPVVELCVNSKLLSLLSSEIKGTSVIKRWSRPEPDYVHKSHLILLLAKAAAHRFFRLISSRPVADDVLVRGWVEVTSKMYENEMRRGVVLIYPFALNIFRQLKFIAYCKKNKLRYQLAGIPYPVIKIIKQFLARVPSDRILMQAEIVANRAHAKELSSRKPAVVFTSDEYETGAFLLYEELVASGVHIVNTAHGVGQYCPYICYTEFRVISDSQSGFYRERNPSIKYDVMPISERQIPGIDSYQLSKDKPLAFVLVHQPFEASALYAEDDAMRSLDNVLFDQSNLLSVRYFIKLHPNYRRGIFRRNNRDFKGDLIHEWKDLNSFRLIFITVNSTVFFDVRGLGPILVYGGATFDPSLYFPKPYLCIDEFNASEVLDSLISVESWNLASALHALKIVPAHDT